MCIRDSLCWAIDNNLTRKVSASDALFIAGSKGMIAGAVNCLLALSFGAIMPNAGMVLATMSIGLLGYGISLVLFVLALRGLGTARTGAYFSTAPFIGAAVALVLLGESTDQTFWLAAGLMAGGVWLHLTEHHEHEHAHEPVSYTHLDVYKRQLLAYDRILDAKANAVASAAENPTGWRHRRHWANSRQPAFPAMPSGNTRHADE